METEPSSLGVSFWKVLLVKAWVSLEMVWISSLGRALPQRSCSKQHREFWPFCLFSYRLRSVWQVKIGSGMLDVRVLN